MKQKAEALFSALGRYTDCIVFLHNTREKAVAQKILSEGFIFENQLAHTSDRINPSDQVEISYFLLQRKEYGLYTIVIAIPRQSYELYSRYSNKLNLPIEELMSKAEPWLNENDEYMYIMPPAHIAGFYDNIKHSFSPNGLYNPGFLSYRDRKGP